MEPTSIPRVEDLLVHGAWLRRLASSLVTSESDADDLVQETWLAALVRGPRRGGEERAWLGRVLRNKATSHARTRGARSHREEANARPEQLPSTSELASRADMSRRLVELVLELPPDLQRITLARYFEGLSSAEIARRLNRPAASVRSQLKRGLDQLRTKLDAENEGERERWLSALTPLVLPRTDGGLLGPLLAASAGMRALVAAALVILAAGVWWMTSGPGASSAPITVIADDSRSELAKVESTDEEQANTVESPAEERVAVAPEPKVAASVIEGRLVHPDTKEPVIWYELGIVPQEEAHLFQGEVSKSVPLPVAESMELVRTDEDGRFSTTSNYESGDYTLVFMEDWRLAKPRMEPFRVRQPRASESVKHDAESPEPHTLELEVGPVFVIDCPKAGELGWESMVATYSYIDHFPPGYFQPSSVQSEPVPFVRMHTDFAPSHRHQANNLRLVSTDGFWSGDVPMEIPDSIATQHVTFDLEARALVHVHLDFGERHPPIWCEMHYWQGAVDPTAEGAPEPDIVELQATFDGTDLEDSIVKYVRTGQVTIGIKSSASEYWYRVLEIRPGHNELDAEILPHPAATGRIEGRVVFLGEELPDQIVGIRANGELDGETTFNALDLEFEKQGDQWIAEFTFTHLPHSTHHIWFDKGGATTGEARTFEVEPARIKAEVDGPPLEFQLHTDLERTRLRIKARDAISGKKINDFAVSVMVPGSWLRSRRADAKAGRATLKLLGNLEGGLIYVAAEGYVVRQVFMSDAKKTSKGLEFELDMTPGWGGPVYITHKTTYEPIAGVHVLLDGAEAGVTDENGHFHIVAPHAPQRLDFELEGYEVTGQSGWINNEGDVIDVGLDPVQRHIGVSMREVE